ncbi:hypothetical protein V2S84_02730 [Azotobacter chroococcum]|nr:hypothetical protein [Azotobacter chroococcum]
MSKAYEDIEIVMHAFRLARDGGYRRAKPLLDDLRAAFPAAPDEQIKRCVGRLASKLMEAA